MNRQFKNLPFTNLKAEANGRSRAGIASVFGNVDAAGDRVMPGAFAKTLAEGARRAKHLWMHSWAHPPIATITELKEVSRDELPPEVLAKSPEATGGLYVKREYLDFDLANAVLTNIDAGNINEMSFAYDVIASQLVDEPIPGQDGKTYQVNNLLELKLLDTSDVLYGCNSATVAAGAKSVLGGQPLWAISQELQWLLEDQKAGRRNSNSDMELIKGMHGMLTTLGYSDCMPKEEEKSDDTAGAALASTSLDLLKLKTRRLHLAAQL